MLSNKNLILFNNVYNNFVLLIIHNLNLFSVFMVINININLIFAATFNIYYIIYNDNMMLDNVFPYINNLLDYNINNINIEQTINKIVDSNNNNISFFSSSISKDFDDFDDFDDDDDQKKIEDLNSYELSVMIGCLLTTADIVYIGNNKYNSQTCNYRFEMTYISPESSDEPEFIDYLLDYLFNLIPQSSYGKYTDDKGNIQYHYPKNAVMSKNSDGMKQFWFCTINDGSFNELFNIWYNTVNGCSIKRMPDYDFLYLYFGILSLSCLIMQNGEWRNDTVYISIHNFSYSEIRTLMLVILNKFNIHSTINPRKDGSFFIRISRSKNNLDILRDKLIDMEQYIIPD
jgi:hypothetical protein